MSTFADMLDPWQTYAYASVCMALGPRTRFPGRRNKSPGPGGTERLHGGE
jgi:hypothetical protein